MTELVSRSEALFMPEAQFSETSLDLPRGMTYDRWEELGHTLGRIHRASGWWIGDWLNFGERVYGHSYSQGMDATGLDYKTLANYAWVASRVESSRRRESLSFSHHAELAALEPPEQDRWLDAAADGDGEKPWSRAELRRRLRDEPVPERSEAVEVRLSVPPDDWDRWDAAAGERGVEVWLCGLANDAAW